MYADRIHRTACGASWQPGEPPKPLSPPNRRIPAAICGSVSIDISLATKEERLSEVELAILNLARWKRQGMLDDNQLFKFLAHWIALESCFPKKRKLIETSLALLYGRIASRLHAQLDVGETATVNALGVYRSEIADEYKRMVRLRNDLVHNGATDLNLSPSLSKDYRIGIYLLRHEILPKCQWVLWDAHQCGVLRLKDVWPNHALHFVLSDQYPRDQFFCRSLYQDASRELLLAHELQD
jgi:hypothetical protein